MNNYLSDIDLFKDSGLQGFGILGLEGKTGEDAPGIFNQVISLVIGIITTVAIVWFVFLVISGAIGIMGSAGDKAAFSKAVQKITNGVIGIIIIFAALFIVSIIGKMFGIENIILNPAEIIINYLTIQ